MAQFQDALVATTFVSGRTMYYDHHPQDEETVVRIVVQVYVNNKTVPCIVDTGAPWCVVDPKITRPLVENGTAEPLRDVYYIIRGCQYKGWLFRVPITLIDQYDEENNLDIDASVFVPTLQPDEEWLHPNFLGLDGFLNRLRFAVDPEENAFYFGRI